MRRRSHVSRFNAVLIRFASAHVLMVAWISILDGPVDDRPLWIVRVITDMEIFVGFLAAASALGMWGKPVQRRVGLTIGSPSSLSAWWGIGCGLDKRTS